MKPTKALLLLLMCLVSVYCLQLTSHKENLKDSFFHPSHKKMSYYGRHYLSHRTEEYIQQVKQDNLEKIEAFNTKNKEALKTVEGELVKGGESYVLGPNKFISFTPEEFGQLFTGLKNSDSISIFNSTNTEEAHQKTNHKLSLEDQKKHSVSQDIFDHMIVSKVDPNLSHDAEKMEIHQEKKSSHNQEETSTDEDDWVFENPFELDDHEIDELYGKANSDDSWGWDWKSFDPDYYDTEEDYDELSDFDTYWKKWDDDHWGFDDEDTLKDGDESPWFKKWLEEAQKNADNPEWWGLDESDDVTEQQASKEEHDKITKNPIQRRVFAEYKQNAKEVNWAKIGATTHVKQQGQCMSCWAFTTAGVMESHLLIYGKGAVDLSEQQMVDCTRGQFNSGCGKDGESGGARLDTGLQFAQKFGVVTEDKYPYRGIDQQCVQKGGPFKIINAKLVIGRAQIEQALRRGPVLAQIHHPGIELYQKGIFSNCRSVQATHAVVLVGYTKDYWIVRNSWGADWGENGHIRIKKDQNGGNACGIESVGLQITYTPPV